MFKYFFYREIKEKYIGNITGISWVFIQPIITLIIYWIVFDKIFGARIPEAKDIGFIVYLAIGFWPWIAFSESVMRSITVISEQSSLIGKVKMDFKILVIAAISASFLLNLIGYILVLIGLVLFADKFHYSGFVFLIFPLIQLYIFALALGLLLSALQIFIKDVLLFMTTIMTMWFFLTPVIYSESILPEKFKMVIKFNPLYTPISFIHKAVISNQPLPWIDMCIETLLLIVFLYTSIKIFDKLSPSFEMFK